MRQIVLSLLTVLAASSLAEAQTTIYWKKDYIRDDSGAAIAVATPQPSETEAPTVPSNLEAAGTTTTSVTLSWTGSTDQGNPAVGLAGYVIYRGPIPVGAVASPGFTDVGLIPNTAYIYRVVAFDNAYNYSGYSNSEYVSTNAASGSPLNLTAAAASASLVNLAWSAPGSGAPDHYGIWRRSNGSWTKIDNSTTNGYADGSVSANTAYMYRISAEESSNQVQGWTNVDIATTVLFTDDPLIAGSTIVKAAHVTELRTAVNAVRAAAGLGAATWTNGSLSGAWIRAVDVTELRTNLGEAINILGLMTPNYTDTTLVGVAVKKAHFDELRLRVK
jgi:hypothetical protein